MLVHAGFTPNSPLLLPNINTDKWHEVEETIHAIERLEEELIVLQPEIIVILSEHPTVYPDAFSITVSDPYHFDLSDFGDFHFSKQLHPDIEIINHLQEHARNTTHPVTLTTDEVLNYASAVPLTLLTKQLPNTKIVPITFAPDLTPKQHFQFGLAIKEAVLHTSKRVVILAAGDLSHALTSDSPANYHAAGKEFDEKVMDFLIHKNTAGLLTLSKDITQNAAQSSYLTLCMLSGALDGFHYTTELLSYEAPFGVGYFTAQFHLS